MFYTWMNDTPVGRLLLAGTSEGLKFLLFDQDSSRSRHQVLGDDWEPNDAHFREPLRQLRAYFAGEPRRFDLKLAADGTDFQQRVWQALQRIPFGETASYLDIATTIGDPKACRAVGMANGKNPISIIVPCHRIVGSGGQLVGYGGGLERKQALLKLEGVEFRGDRIRHEDQRQTQLF